MTISYPDGTNRKALLLAIARARGDSLTLRKELEATNSAQLMPIAKAAVTAHTVADLPGYTTIVDDFAKAMVSNSFLDYVTTNNLANVAQLYSRYAIYVSGSAGSVAVGEAGMKPIASAEFGTLEIVPQKAVPLWWFRMSFCASPTPRRSLIVLSAQSSARRRIQSRFRR